ncbi:hypothetical protein LX32DRAFT_153288 [Colletotrichum zoysiae]|uniref:Transmembrane protein n=1 Tax=Colletotrichum zoysiae TaxID=1216348 RepID=A0AAD9HU57_9PEZI|nr:hypothetical protein LX32DRAFT_153288 [Colletotrichum zoysiae]
MVSRTRIGGQCDRPTDHPPLAALHLGIVCLFFVLFFGLFFTLFPKLCSSLASAEPCLGRSLWNGTASTQTPGVVEARELLSALSTWVENDEPSHVVKSERSAW